MPNHYATMLICTPGYDVDEQEIARRLNETVGGLCQIVAPAPADMSDSCGFDKGEESVWRNGVKLTAEERAEIVAKYGTDDWFAWAGKHWGTKWGTYRHSAMKVASDGSPVVLAFASAWGPPVTAREKIDAWLREQYKFEAITWVGHDPYDGSTKVIGSAKESEESL